MTQRTSYYALGGGLDLTTPAIQVAPGRAISSNNYEPVPGGYRRCDGYERCDGRPSPSSAQFVMVTFDQGSAAISEGDTVVGGTSGSYGLAIFDAAVESGSYGDGDAAGHVVLTAFDGEFQDGEDLQVSSATKCVCSGTLPAGLADTDEHQKAWKIAAIEAARALITAVPGSGPLRGVWSFHGVHYAFRDNAAGTAGVMHKSTAAGWVAVDLGDCLGFVSGTTEFKVGETVTGGTSGATGTIERVVRRTGAWDGSAEGLLVLSGIVGDFEDGEAITSASGAAEADGADEAITLPAGGRYDFQTHNFYGASDRERMYFANAVGPAMEWDGTVMVPILTGMGVDKPTHIAAHSGHLFLMFPGGSVQHSGIGDPYAWSPVLGAAEIGLGQEGTGFLPDFAGTLVIFGRNMVAVLYGTDSSNWEFKKYASDAGGIEWTIQKVGDGYYMDDRGLRGLSTTQAFGDFRRGTITTAIQPILALKRKGGVSPIASLRVRTKDQYRLFYDDGTGLYVYLGGKSPEIMTFDLGRTVRCCCSAEDADGNEILLFGSDDGYVYQLDSGAGFDGQSVQAHLRLPFNHVGSPTVNKRWHKATAEVESGPDTVLGMTAEFDYASPNQPAANLSLGVSGGGGFWNESSWDDFYWSSPVEGLAEAHFDGIGRNVSITIYSDATHEEPHTVHGLTLHYSGRGLLR